MKKIIFVILQVLVLNIFSQDIVYETNSYTYFVDKSKYTVINFDIKNMGDSMVILWLDNNPQNNNQAVEKKFYDYFLKRKGDFSLFNLIGEYGSTIENVSINIYSTFYKLIEVNKSFCITIFHNQNDSISNAEIINELKKQIVIVSENKLPKLYPFSDYFQHMSFRDEQIILYSNDIYSFSSQ